jgi:hypothetical protein
MNKITAFNKISAAAFRADLAAVLAKYGMESNLDLKIGTIRFSGAEARMQIEAKVKGAVTKEDRTVENLIVKYNLREVSAGGEKLVGYNARAHRYPIIYARGGKKYKTSLDHAKFLFAK